MLPTYLAITTMPRKSQVYDYLWASSFCWWVTSRPLGLEESRCRARARDRWQILMGSIYRTLINLARDLEDCHNGPEYVSLARASSLEVLTSSHV